MWGRCKLCLSDAEIQDSHLLPKAAYRILQKSDGQAPVVFKRTVSVHSNEQIRDYVLCTNCEQRFSNNGERWVMEHCFRNEKGFRLKELVESSKPLVEAPIRVYSVAGIPEVNVDKLTYFATSILWRASVHHWKSGKDPVGQLYLGRYTADLRRYLLDETALPKNIVMLISLIPEPKLWLAAGPPYGFRINDFWEYRLPFLGISFTMLLGARIDSIIRPLCSYRSAERFIFTGDKVTQMVTRDFGLLISNSRPVGSLGCRTTTSPHRKT